MVLGRYRALISIALFAAWLLITVFASRLWTQVHAPQALAVGVSRAIEPALVAAVVFLVAAILVFRWRDLGLNAPRGGKTFKVIWFPCLYIVCFVGLAAVTGLPPAATLLIILVNTILVGISEELACRGVLYQGLRSQFTLWTAILGSSVLFGAAHLLNGFTTGDFGAAATQSLTAFMTGIAFMAIRLRTGSLLPGMAIHAVWDFILVATAAGVARTAAPEVGSGGLQLLPVLLILPNFLYGLFLMRHATRDEVTATADR